MGFGAMMVFGKEFSGICAFGNVGIGFLVAEFDEIIVIGEWSEVDF